MCRSGFCMRFFFWYLLIGSDWIDLRVGQVVLFQLPGSKKHTGIELGLVIGCWQGIKAPKMTERPVSVNSCLAFRAVALDSVKQDRDEGNGGLLFGGKSLLGCLMFFDRLGVHVKMQNDSNFSIPGEPCRIFLRVHFSRMGCATWIACVRPRRAREYFGNPWTTYSREMPVDRGL